MAHTDLPVNIDSSYTDDTAHPDVQIHQGHHDELHYFHNLFDITDVPSWPNGGIAFYDTGTGKFAVLNPSITGSPGPTGKGMRFLAAWSGATAYVNNTSFTDIVTYNGHVWACVTGNTNSAPTSANTNWAILVPGTNWTGPWASGTTYDPGDLAQFGGGTYIALARHSASQPPSPNWATFAAAGVNGSDGQQGTTGPAGPAGPAGPVEETLAGPTSVSSGVQVLDPATATFHQLVLNGDIHISLQDSTGEAISKLVLEVVQGTGAPNVITWDTAITWLSGAEPVLSTSTGELDVITFYQVNGQWRGATPGSSGTPAPPSYPTLATPVAFGNFVDTADHTYTSADPASFNYVSPSSYQLGNQIGGLLWVEIERGDSVEPGVPAVLDGSAGGSVWTLAASTIHGTGTTRRMLALFVGLDTVTGVSAPITVVPNASDRVNGTVMTGCHVVGLKTAGIVPPGWATTAVSKAIARKFNDTGNNQATPTCTLASPADSDSRTVVGFDIQNSAGTFTPSNWTTITDDPPGSGSPVMRMFAGWNDTAFQTAPSGTLSINANWGLIATEMVQG